MKENKQSSLELDLNEFSKEELIKIILFGHKNNFTFNQVITHVFGEVCKLLECNEKEKI